MKEFSSFISDRGITLTKPSGAMHIKTCAENIRADEDLIKKTSELRSIPPGGPKTFGFNHDKTERDAFKEGFPYVTFSGTFKSRENNKLIERSEYFCVDLDHIGPIEQIRDKGRLICTFHTPALMFISPSGDGLKVVFQIDPSAGSHEEYFIAFRNFFDTKIHFPIDKNCKDISRATFLCHDPDVFLADDPAPDVLGKDFLFHDEVPATDNGRSYENAKKWTESKETFIDGNRNHFIVTLADTCIRYAIEMTEALPKIIADFAGGDFTAEEITTTVENRYKLHPEWFGIAAAQPAGEKPFIRVNVNYHKVINIEDRYNIRRKELILWNKDTLITDYGRKYLKDIPKYDRFIIVPDNLNYQSVIKNCYNLYSEFCHKPAPGDWTWTKRLLEHVFGEQYEQGLRYMQILYLYPERQTVILVLVSAERGTGKTTFLNWLNMIFGDNMVLLSATDFLNDFNFYAKKNIITIEETLFEKKLTIERIKSLATQKNISINEKFIRQYMLPFYGKLILTSNFEDKFALVDAKEIRFLVRKLGTPVYTNHSIEDDLLTEIPAFLDYLQSLPPLNWKNPPSRSGFSAEELRNDSLTAVMKESRHDISKELVFHIEDYFNEHESLTHFYAAAKDIKKEFFNDDHRNGKYWISRALKDDFDMIPEELQRYYPFEELTAPSKPGTPYLFKRIDWCKNGKLVKNEEPPY